MTVHASEEQAQVDGSAEPEPAAERSRRPMLAGALGSAWALLVGVALVALTVMLAWAVAPNSAGDSAAAWRAVGAVWLGAHQVPLDVSGAPITLLPIGGLLLGLLLTRRSGSWAARMLPSPTAAEITRVMLGAAAIYGAGGAGVAWVSGGGSVAADPATAAWITASIALVGSLWGFGREAQLLPAWRGGGHRTIGLIVTGGVAAVLGMLAAGAALVSLGLITGFPEVVGALGDLDAGFVGSFGVTLLGALSLPTLAIWALSLIVGPGFDLGGLGGLSAFGGQVESLPALPVLAAIPATAPAWAPVLLAVPVGLGVLAGRIRWGRDLPTPVGVLTSGAGVGSVVAALVGGLVVLASGSLGDDQLAHVGPAVLPVMGSAAGLVLLGFLAEAGYQALRLSWDLHLAERRAQEPGDADGADGTADPGAAIPGAEQADAVPGDAEQADAEQAGTLAGRATSARRVAGRVADAGGAVTSGITGVGGAVASGIAGAGASAVSLVSSAGARVASLAPSTAEGAGASGEGAAGGDPLADASDRSAEPDSHEVPAESSTGRDCATQADTGSAGCESAGPGSAGSQSAGSRASSSAESATRADAESAGPGSADTGLEPHAAEPAASEVATATTTGHAHPDSDTRPADAVPSDARPTGDGLDVVDLRPTQSTPVPEPVQPSAGDHEPALPQADRGRGPGGGADDDTDEIPITRRVPASDPARP